MSDHEIPIRRLKMQGQNIQILSNERGADATAIFEAEQVNERGEVVATFEMEFQMSPFQLRCLGIQSERAHRFLVNDRKLLGPGEGFKITDKPALDDDGEPVVEG